MNSSASPHVTAIIPAAGLSTRMGSTTAGADRKQMLEVAGAPVLVHTLRRFEGLVDRIIVALRPEDRDRVAGRLLQETFATPIDFVNGGDNRQLSVGNALAQVAGDDTLVAVHDAVRPFIDRATIVRVLAAAREFGAAIVALPAIDTVKQVQRAGGDANRITATLPRERIVLAQTPQVFRAGLLRRAFAAAEADGFYATDEASLLEHIGQDVYVVPGSPRNWKITTPADIPLAEMFFAAEARLAATPGAAPSHA